MTRNFSPKLLASANKDIALEEAGAIADGFGHADGLKKYISGHIDKRLSIAYNNT